MSDLLARIRPVVGTALADCTVAVVGAPAAGVLVEYLAALWVARLMAQMMLPASLREGWLLARLAAGAHCLIGGGVVEMSAAGAAYGVRVPGEVHAWSSAEIRGVAATGDASSMRAADQ